MLFPSLCLVLLLEPGACAAPGDEHCPARVPSGWAQQADVVTVSTDSGSCVALAALASLETFLTPRTLYVLSRTCSSLPASLDNLVCRPEEGMLPGAANTTAWRQICQSSLASAQASRGTAFLACFCCATARPASDCAHCSSNLLRRPAAWLTPQWARHRRLVPAAGAPLSRACSRRV